MMRMKVKSIASGLYGEDSSEFAILNSEHLRERSPSGTKEYGVELAVVLKEHPQAFWDGEDGVAVGNIFDYLTVNMLCEFDRSLCPAGWTYSTAFATSAVSACRDSGLTHNYSGICGDTSVTDLHFDTCPLYLAPCSSSVISSV